MKYYVVSETDYIKILDLIDRISNQKNLDNRPHIAMEDLRYLKHMLIHSIREIEYVRKLEDITE